MELKFIEDKKNRVVVEIKGETHTFLNVLKDELWNDDSVKVSAYRVDHPLIGSPKLIVETSGESAKDALIKAAQRLQKQFDKFGSEVSKVVK